MFSKIIKNSKLNLIKKYIGVDLSKINLSFLNSKKISSKDIMLFTRQLATMLSSGIPLLKTFDIILKTQTNIALKKIIENIKNDLKEGCSLKEAFLKHPNYFNEHFCALVHAGEKSGALTEILERLAIYKEKTESMKKKIKQALFYPIIVVAFAVIVTACLLIFVVPQFEMLFKGFGGDLPFFTQCIISLSQFIQNYYLTIFFVLCILIFSFITMMKKSKRFSELVDCLMLKLPVLGMILKDGAVASFSRSLATTFAAGLPIVDCLSIASKTTGHFLYQKACMQVGLNTAKGESLHHALKLSKVFPEMLIQMVACGEESGMLEAMLSNVAEFYEQRVEHAIDQLSSLIEPLIMIVLGLIIGGLIIAMYLPVFKMGGVI